MTSKRYLNPLISNAPRKPCANGVEDSCDLSPGKLAITPYLIVHFCLAGEYNRVVYHALPIMKGRNNHLIKQMPRKAPVTIPIDGNTARNGSVQPSFIHHPAAS